MNTKMQTPRGATAKIQPDAAPLPLETTRFTTVGLPQTGLALACALAAAMAANGAFAQQAFDEDLDNWNYDQVYQGWSAENLLDDAEVYGTGGEEIGSVENLLIDDDGQIVAVIAEVGGFWDIGDTHIAVPWDQVNFNGTRLTIPVREDNVDDYGLFDTGYFTRWSADTVTRVDDDLNTGTGIWKATQLLDDYTVLENGDGYGYVDDLVFNDEGMLESVLVDVSYGNHRGYYGYPWYGAADRDDFAWEAGSDYYVLPYSTDVIVDFDTVLDLEQIASAPD